MNHLFHYTHRSHISDLLEMVNRGCQRLARVGGIISEPDQNPKRTGMALPKAKVAAIIRRVEAGEDRHRIAADLGVHYQTVWRHSRHVRGVEAKR